MANSNNRWEFIDYSQEHPDEVKFAPLLVIEDDEFNYEFISAGHHFDKPEEATRNYTRKISIIKKHK